MDSWNRVEIDLAALRHNFGQIRRRVGMGVDILAVVKSEAYGHGLIPCARALRQAGATTFGVAEVEEGLRLRGAGVDGRIVVMLGVDRHGAEESVRHDLTPVVYDLEAAEALHAAAARAGRRLGIHLKVDVGMGRLGLLPQEVPAFLDRLDGLPSLYLAGMVSHFPKADVEDDPAIAQQAAAFREVMAQVATRTGGNPLQHLANSAALLRTPTVHCDMVRPGISLYGCYPAEWLRGPETELRPAMRMLSRVIQVKEVPAGYGVSYGHRFVAQRPTRLAVLPVGYHDGWLRRLTGKAEVLINGRRVPVVGTICMNACMADVTDLVGVAAGDEAVFLGCQGGAEITADEIAAWSGTINYEILCLFGSCNRRTYINGEGNEEA
ncbi:MAG: alanine racemase [Thermodesulfobacteriota bacterium]